MNKATIIRGLVKLLYGAAMFYFVIYQMMMELTAESADAGAGFFAGVVFTVFWVVAIQCAGIAHDWVKELIASAKRRRNNRKQQWGNDSSEGGMCGETEN